MPSQALGRSVSAQLAANEIAHVSRCATSARLAPPMPNTESIVASIEPFEGGFGIRYRRITLTISENLKGFLLVAEIQRENDTWSEMANFRLACRQARARPAVYDRQEDVVGTGNSDSRMWRCMDDQMLVLDTAG